MNRKLKEAIEKGVAKRARVVEQERQAKLYRKRLHKERVERMRENLPKFIYGKVSDAVARDRSEMEWPMIDRDEAVAMVEAINEIDGFMASLDESQAFDESFKNPKLFVRVTWDLD